MLTEFDEACLLAEYLDLKHIKYSHIAQETWTPSWGQRMKNKRQGVKKGVPDYIIIIKNRLIFIELKREKGGVLSEEQKEWISALADCGIRVHVCKGFNESKKVIDDYIKKLTK